MRVEARAPARVDLAGGTIDIWPLYLFHPDAQTVNVAIKCHASCVIETRSDRRVELVSRDQNLRESWETLASLSRGVSKLPLLRELVTFFQPRGGFNITTDSEVPAGAGLGGSSTLNIALCGALARYTGRRHPHHVLLEIARNVEAMVIRVPTGWQDYFPALYGGVNSVHLNRDGVKVERLRVPPTEVEQRFVLCYTGQPRNSAINNWEVMKAHIDNSARVIKNFDQIATISSQMREALLERNWDEVGSLLAREWENRKRNFKGISTPKIDRMIQQSRKQGSVAAKVCGAGGGGCVIFMVEPGTKPGVEKTLTQLGGKVINFAISTTGLEVNAGPVRPR